MASRVAAVALGGQQFVEEATPSMAGRRCLGKVVGKGVDMHLCVFDFGVCVQSDASPSNKCLLLAGI